MPRSSLGSPGVNPASGCSQRGCERQILSLAMPHSWRGLELFVWFPRCPFHGVTPRLSPAEAGAVANRVLVGTSLTDWGRAGGGRLGFLGCADHPTSLSPSTSACAMRDIHIVTPVPLFPKQETPSSKMSRTLLDTSTQLPSMERALPGSTKTPVLLTCRMVFVFIYVIQAKRGFGGRPCVRSGEACTPLTSRPRVPSCLRDVAAGKCSQTRKTIDNRGGRPR